MMRAAPTCRPNRSSLLLGLLVLAALGSTQYLRVNISSSAPLGLYYLAPVSLRITRGMLVVLPVPVSVRRWTAWPHVDLLKPVAGVAGDAVCAAEEGLTIAGEAYGPVLQEAHGKRLPHMAGCFMVAYGDVMLASKTRHSLDSRYFGPVRIQHLTAIAHPLWTWR